MKLVELQRDLVGIDNLVQPGREFLREGCLQKLSRKGYQQRMFFLVSINSWITVDYAFYKINVLNYVLYIFSYVMYSTSK